jgi:hypothetical protein
VASQQRTAFITARKGFSYLMVKCGRQNFHVLRIRNDTLDAVLSFDRMTGLPLWPLSRGPK